jgi:hypothetical protein
MVELTPLGMENEKVGNKRPEGCIDEDFCRLKGQLRDDKA